MGLIVKQTDITPELPLERYRSYLLLLAHLNRNAALDAKLDASEKLPEPQREALLLKHCEGLTLEETGKRLGRSVAAVASLLRRGVKALRAACVEMESNHERD